MKIKLNQSGVYTIENTVNGKLYVGSAVNFKQRFSVHKSLLRRGKHINRHLQSAWVKYGENLFRFRIFIICDKGNVLFYEQKVIDVYHPEYNICPVAGNTLGQVFSIKARKKMSESAKRKHFSVEHRRKISESLRIRVYSDETRKKLSESGKRESNCFTGIAQRGESNPFQGKKHTAKTKLLLSELAKNRSDDHKKKISTALRGRVPWNKGKTGVYSKETLKKMSESRKAQIVSKKKAVINE